MERISLLCLGLVFFSTTFGAGETRSSPTGKAAAYSHAYYLFLADPPKGCEDCYVPLLITAEPLGNAAKAKGPQAGVLIITYERDSIWHDDGMVSLAPGDIEVAPRVVHLRGRKYRYQEISSAEVLKLLENPRGTIPISRPYVADVRPAGPSLEQLIADFRNSK